MGGWATILWTDGADHLTGTPGPDVISAGAGDDHVDGGGGDDVVCGGAGDDVLLGGAGDDVLLGGAGDDRPYGEADARPSDEGGTHTVGDPLVGGPGNDLLDVGRRTDSDSESVAGGPGTISYGDAARGVAVDLARGTATGDGHDRVVLRHGLVLDGSPHDDHLGGYAGPDDILGERGNDVIDGRGGDDLLVADSERHPDARGSDTLVGGAGNDLLISRAGRDRLLGGPGTDDLAGYGAQPLVLRGGPGTDVLTTSLRTTSGFVIDGGPGRDTAAVNLTTAADFRVPAGAAATVDARAGTVTVHVDHLTSTGRFTGNVEVVMGASKQDRTTAWTYRGTSASERLLVDGRSLHAELGGGNDHVTGTDVCEHVEHRSGCEATS